VLHNHLRAILRRLLPWRGSTMPFVFHERYLGDMPVPQYDHRRPLKILSFLESQKLIPRRSVRRPRPASLARLGKVHDAAYLQSLERRAGLSPILGFEPSAEAHDRFLSCQRAMVGGTILATKLALRSRGPAVNLGGGLHHARRDAGHGFCALNDVAIAISAFRKNGYRRPILVVDLDIHDGDGTRQFFADDPTVHTFSIHNRHLGETDAVASTSIELGVDVEDDRYLAVLREQLPPVIAQVRPGLVYYLAGCDPAVEDKLGDWRISIDGLLARDRFVMEQIVALAGGARSPRDHGYSSGRTGSQRSGRLRVDVPCVLLLAGGYGHSAWRHGARFFTWLLTGNDSIVPPLDIEFPVDHYRRLTKLMKSPRQSETKPGLDADDWGLNDEDLGAVGSGGETRFLGRYSRLAVERALEDCGLLERLRAKGFKGLRIDIDLSAPMGHTLRILTRGEQPRPVMELRLRRDRSLARDREFLFVEWLLIQDTRQGPSEREAFTLERPLLPGQHYPGLGLLRDTVAALVVVCEQLDLDGIAFVPTHFYLAKMAKPMGYFWNPTDEARFLAVQQSLRGLRLGEIIATIERGGVVDETTGEPFVWQPAPMIIPVKQEVRDRASGRAFADQVAEAAKGFSFGRVEAGGGPSGGEES